MCTVTTKSGTHWLARFGWWIPGSSSPRLSPSPNPLLRSQLRSSFLLGRHFTNWGKWLHLQDCFQTKLCRLLYVWPNTCWYSPIWLVSVASVGWLNYCRHGLEQESLEELRWEWISSGSPICVEDLPDSPVTLCLIDYRFYFELPLVFRIAIYC